ncbi:myo-inositol 2-dehydrogenase/D-chiro-inositol 1-dehydrogenase [Frondihabitans sp. PhB188]|uniref:Gfo/Idh/MocA family protein n=1 Tax=Frondihabitans sp. PhB188 TaxID=2485200 RepID=UPI000F470717|nr:Gfo/Idh/MocA family oxidoreductase [Frondihabitans sp. PhB188]ROQ30309.1 myo-inositol 2-dehydrogenase/D-chiro-inositol 1-dehydrogenase [Frondihabitans sp. PhB188]
MRVGVYGLGKIGVMHARNLAQNPEVDEVVLIGRDAGRLATAHETVLASIAPGAPAEIAGAHAPAEAHAVVSTTLDALDDVLPTLHGIVVATSTDTHAALALQVAEAGTPLLIEKPLCLTSAALEELSTKIEATGTPVMVAFHRRYDPGYQALRDRIASGEIGPVRVARAVDNDRTPLRLSYIPESRGVWFDLLIHDFDATPWATGQNVVSVSAFGSVIDEPVYAEHNDADTAVAVLEFDSGAIATVVGTRKNGAGQDCRLEVFGSDGTLSSGIDPRTAVVSTEPGIEAPRSTYPDYQARFEPAFRSEAAHLVRMARGEAPSLTTPRSGLVATRIAEAAAESFATGTRISLA